MNNNKNLIVTSIIKSIVQEVLSEKLADRVQDVPGLNKSYAGKVCMGLMKDSVNVDPNNIDLSQFKKEKFKVIKFINITASSDGKRLGIALLPNNAKAYIDLVSLTEVEPSTAPVHPNNRPVRAPEDRSSRTGSMGPRQPAVAVHEGFKNKKLTESLRNLIRSVLKEESNKTTAKTALKKK